VEGLVIPTMSAVAACVLVVIILTSAFKSIIKCKALYVWLPLMLSLPIGFVAAFSEVGWTSMLIETAIVRVMSITAGAMSSYDIVSKTVKRWRQQLEDDDKEVKK
jgi:uncharacterized membrane protein